MFFQRRRVESKLDAELQFHMASMAEQYVNEGMTPEQARRRVRMEFGGTEQIKEEIRDVWAIRWLEELISDLRYARRGMRRSPAFLMVAILSLALGIGANTAIFSLFNAVMLRSMPVLEPERLVQLYEINAEGLAASNISPTLREYLSQQSQSFAGVLWQVMAGDSVRIDFQGREDTVSTALVSGSYHTVLGLRPATGRLFTPEDDRASPVAVISHRYWQRRFALDPSIVGKTFALNGIAFAIVGVTPSEFFGTVPGNDPDVTFTSSMAKDVLDSPPGASHVQYVMARLKPYLATTQATAEINGIYRNWLRERLRNPKDRDAMLRQRMELSPAGSGFEDLRRQFSAPLRILMVAAGFVLLLACVNLSSLLLARAAGRQREIAVRKAIGAGRGRLIRQFLTESLLLTLVGGVIGTLLAGWFSIFLVTTMANGRTWTLPLTPDWRVLAFMGAIMIATCILVGMAPGLYAARMSANSGLKEVKTGRRRSLGRALVITQVSISMLLLVGASLFVGTLIKLYRLDAGFQRDGILTFSLDSRRKPDGSRERAIEMQLVDGLNAIPAVVSASSAGFLQIGSYGISETKFEGAGSASAYFNYVGPKFFETIRTAIVLGREFNKRDDADAPKVAIINEGAAQHLFPGGSPLGRHVNDAEIVGVAKDAKQSNLRAFFATTVYYPRAQFPGVGAQPSYLVRVSGGDPKRLAPLVQRVVHDIDPDLRLKRLETFAEHVDKSLLNERIMADLSGFFGALALILAGVGIFGVMAFQAARRTNEFGVRLALGASQNSILSLVLGDAGLVMVAGLVIGGGAAAALTRVAKEMLYGLTPTDPLAFASAAVLLFSTGVLAAYLPARRASRVDPMIALRHD